MPSRRPKLRWAEIEKLDASGKDPEKLKELMVKRQKMLSALGQAISRYNETAKGTIQSIGR